MTSYMWPKTAQILEIAAQIKATLANFKLGILTLVPSNTVRKIASLCFVHFNQLAVVRW